MTLAVASETSRTQLAVHIRWMLVRDLDDVSLIEVLANPGDAWTPDEFTRSQRRRSCIGMVAVTNPEKPDERVVGYMLYELLPDSLELLRFGVMPSRHEREIAAQLLAKLKSKLSNHRRTSVTIDVPETKLAFLLTLRANGFKAVQVNRQAFGDEDGIAMEYSLEGGDRNG